MSDDSAGTSPRPTGLREAKKQETRQHISDQATRLFLAQGFDATTIAEIADAARVSKKTVTNYFARKEDLALDRQDAFVATLASAVAARRPGESALGALRRAFEGSLAAHDPVTGFTGAEFARMAAESPTLTHCVRGLHDRREEALAEALAEAGGAPGGDATARTVAGLLGAVHRVLFGRIQHLTLAGYAAWEIERLVAPEGARAFDLLEPSLGRLYVA
ncbi:TetR family transcriptional regulator [Streptomyces chumphonensis]|uniref:TetR family transcriptional regulator n=1 Tax=Streptomyces chumphonensis TaxID=1214925 RepID=A0A927EWY0_9ACTN|nr:TetR family transcriptional regulator [Streptomyces chumphonensis]MBD3930507.1 TetR family transcriptional regulator [Streptomyces chumphonensis]